MKPTHRTKVHKIGHSDDEYQRDCLSYEYDATDPDTGEVERVKVYSKPRRVADGDLEIKALNNGASTSLSNRLKADREKTHGRPFEFIVTEVVE